MSEIRVDTISEKTSANGVSIDGLTIKDGGIKGTGAQSLVVGSTDGTSARLVLDATNGDASGGDFPVLTADGTSLNIAANNSGGNAFMTFQTNSGEDMRIGPNGKVGIGTASPATTLDVVGNATITTADNTDTLTLKSTDADATVGPNLNFYRNSGSPADNDDLGKIVFNGRNDNSQDVVYAQIRSTIVDASDGTEDGLVKHDVSLGGTAYQHLSMGNGSIVFNEESQDIDFRVESNGNANMLFVDGGNDKVGIGTNAPARTVQIVDSSATPYLSIVGPTGSGAGIMLGDTDDETVGRITYDNSGNNLQLWTNDAEQVRIHSNGVLSASDGIALGVGTANTASNVLDDYEEGVTGNVSLTCGSSGSASLQTNFKKLAYTKVGRLVTITGLLKITSVSSPTGGLTFALPFALASLGDTAEICRGHGYIVNAANAENGDGGLLVDIQTEGGTSALIAKTDNTANGLRDLDSTFLTSQAEISLSFSYFTA